MFPGIAVFSGCTTVPEFGYQAIKLMARALKGDKSFIPGIKQIIVPTLIVNKANVDEFSTKLNGLLGK